MASSIRAAAVIALAGLFVPARSSAQDLALGCERLPIRHRVLHVAPYDSPGNGAAYFTTTVGGRTLSGQYSDLGWDASTAPLLSSFGAERDAVTFAVLTPGPTASRVQHVSSRNHPDYFGQGCLAGGIDWVATFRAEGSLATVSTRMFDLTNGQVVIAAPQSDDSIKFLQVDVGTIYQPPFPESFRTMGSRMASLLDRPEVHAFLAANPWEDALRVELLERVERDQAVQEAMMAPGADVPTLDARKDSVFAANAAWLAPFLDDGWPDASRVGEDGSRAAYFIVQHADHDPALQQRALPLLERAVADGLASGEDLAYLTDRVRVGQGRPQVYGTQLDYVGPNNCPVPKTVDDEEGLDERRARVGLDPIGPYLRRVATMLGRGDACSEWRAGRSG